MIRRKIVTVLQSKIVTTLLNLRAGIRRP
jgi:hypothetical protein